MSTIASTQPPARRRFNLRAFLAGGTATAALIAAAVIVFGSLAAYVAFDGAPVRGDDPPTDTVTVGAPHAAAATLGRAPRVVAATPAAPTAIAPAPAPTPAPAAAAAAGVVAGTPGAELAPGTTIVAPGTDPAVPSTTESPVAPTTPTAPAPVESDTSTGTGSSGSGTLGGAVDQIDQVTGGGLGLGEATDSVTGPLDNTVDQVNDTLNNVAPGLGDQVNDTLDGVLGG